MKRPGLFTAQGVFVLVVAVMLSHFTAAGLLAGGYKILEQSSNSVGLSAAYVANAYGPDAAFYNPANMVWSDEGAALETSFTYIHLPAVKFRGTVRFDIPSTPPSSVTLDSNADSKSENFFLPNIHYISPKMGKARFGFSLVYPFGLTKRWDARSQKSFAEEFTLKVIELDAAVGYEVNEKLAVGGGIRGIYSDGEVKSDGRILPSTLPQAQFTRDLEGDDLALGYYAAISVKPVEHFAVAVTYRSEVTPTLEGNAKLSSGALGGSYNGSANVEVVLPATFQAAAAYTYRKSVFEFVYERTYWGAYEKLDFNYGATLHPSLVKAFDDSVARNYNDTDTYRFGLTYHYNPALDLLLGFGIDETPVPEKTLGFELPDADALIYSTGFRYRKSDRMAISLTYLTSQKEKRTVTTNDSGIVGNFESGAHLVNASVIITF